MNAQQSTIICDRLRQLTVEVSEESEQSTTASLNSKEPKSKKPRHESAIDFLLGDRSSTLRSPEDEVDDFMKEPAVESISFSIYMMENKHSLLAVTIQSGKVVLMHPSYFCFIREGVLYQRFDHKQAKNQP